MAAIDGGGGEHEGALHGLQRLQERLDRLNKKREAQLRAKAEVSELKKTVEERRSRKAKLQERLERGPREILEEYLDQRKAGVEIPEEQKKVVSEIAQSLRKRKLTELCDAFRLVGISIESQKENKTCYRLDTFFNCKYFKPYYVEVASGQKLKVVRHSVPYFVPLDKIADTHLNSDTKMFFTTLTEYLNSFVARKEQVHLLQEHLGERLAAEVSCSPPYDFIQFTVKVSGEVDQATATNIEVKLGYEDLKRSLPSTVKIQAVGKKAPRRRFNSEKKLFQELHIHEAFSQAFA